MDRLLSIEAFTRVAETGNFAKAAQQLGVTRSVITHRIQQLEGFINAPLFHRSTRHVRLSEVGEMYYKECADMVANFNALTEQMRELSAKPAGKLRVHVAPGFALDYFGFFLAEFMQMYPDVEVEAAVGDQIVDPIEEGFDVAFQIFPPVAESLIERKLFRVQRVFCAAPQYIQKYGAPSCPQDLLKHKIGVYGGYPSRYRFVFRREGREEELNLSGQMRTSAIHLLRDFALGGAAIVCLPTIVASKDLLAGRLMPVLTDYALPPLSLRAVFPSTQRRAVKVRSLIDFLSERLEYEPLWDLPLLERGWIHSAGQESL